MEAASPPESLAQQPAADSQGDVHAGGGTSSEEEELSQEQADSEQCAAAAAAAGKRHRQPGECARSQLPELAHVHAMACLLLLQRWRSTAGCPQECMTSPLGPHHSSPVYDADDDSDSDADSEPGSKRARIQGEQQLVAAAAVPQVKTEEAEAPDAAAAAAAAAGAAAAPMPAPDLALTAEQQQAMMLHGFSMLSPEALAAAQAALPTGPDGQPLQLTLPLIGPGGESLPSLVLDPSVILSGQIMGPNGEELTQEQVGSWVCDAQPGCKRT